MLQKQSNQQNDDGSDGKRPRLPRPGGKQRFSRVLILVVAGALMVTWLWSTYGQEQAAAPQIDYTTFQEELGQGNVGEVVISGDEIRGTLQTPRRRMQDGDTLRYTDFVTYGPGTSDDLLAELEAQGVQVRFEPETDTASWWMILLNALPFLLLVGLGLFFFMAMRKRGQMAQQIRNIGESKARLYDREQEHTTFEDVAGAESAKQELEEIVAFLKDPDRFSRLGGQIPRGVLLVGPPGTGKTLLARAVAGEAGVPFYSMSGSDFMEMFVGVGASRVRDMFKKAKEDAPAIIFIDELDSIGRQRGAGLGQGHDEREQTLNQLLSELDGFEPNEGVIVMAATNRPDILDSALTRAGRFDRRVTVHLPSAEHRRQILEIHAKGKPLADDVDLGRVARGTPGFSGADLENLLNEAALLAARKDQDAIERENIEEARDKTMMGLERKGIELSERELEMIAYHEAGHAVVAAAMPHAEPIHKVSVIPRGRAMGVTQQLPEKERFLYQREYMLDRLAVMMGGRAAEDIVFDTATSGAENDLKEATKLVRKMVVDWGMSDAFTNVAMGSGQQEVFIGQQMGKQRDYSEATAQRIDEEVQKILEQAYERALATLNEHHDAFEQTAHLLLEHEEIDGERVLALMPAGHDDEAAESTPPEEAAETPAEQPEDRRNRAQEREEGRS